MKNLNFVTSMFLVTQVCDNYTRTNVKVTTRWAMVLSHVLLSLSRTEVWYIPSVPYNEKFNPHPKIREQCLLQQNSTIEKSSSILESKWQGQFPLPDRGPTNLIEWLIGISFWNWYCRIIQNKWYTMCTASFVDCLQSTSGGIWADTVCLSSHEGRKHSRRHVFSYADARFSSQTARWRVGHRGIRLSAARLTTTV